MRPGLHYLLSIGLMVDSTHSLCCALLSSFKLSARGCEPSDRSAWSSRVQIVPRRSSHSPAAADTPPWPCFQLALHACMHCMAARTAHTLAHVTIVVRSGLDIGRHRHAMACMPPAASLLISQLALHGHVKASD